eukprot:scaffold468719_cov36-Prasinocladus_malaysianus.AAC.1
MLQSILDPCLHHERSVPPVITPAKSHFMMMQMQICWLDLSYLLWLGMLVRQIHSVMFYGKMPNFVKLCNWKPSTEWLVLEVTTAEVPAKRCILGAM